MRLIAAALALALSTAACGPILYDHEACLTTISTTQICEGEYMWVDGYYDRRWDPGFGWRYEWRVPHYTRRTYPTYPVYSHPRGVYAPPRVYGRPGYIGHRR